jgi:hypothetical protein
MFAEDKVKLPEIQVPAYHGASDGVDFTEGPMFLLHPSDKGWITATRDNGTSFRIERPEDILKLFPDKFNWTYSKAGELDCVFKSLNKKQLTRFIYTSEVEIDGHTIKWLGLCTAKITLDSGSTTRYLINAGAWTSKSTSIDDFEKLKDLVSKLITMNRFGVGINLLSPASTTKSLVLREAGSNFKIINKLNHDDLEFLHSGYKGPRMETKSLGTIEFAETMDMKRAYLRILSEVPTLNKDNVLVRRGDKFKSKSAHPGSVYLVRVVIPKGYSAFPPIPFRTTANGIGYPTGEFVAYLSRPYIDILEQVGTVEYEILDSLQFIILNANGRPFQELCGIIEYFEDTYRESLYPIFVKGLHMTIAGHFLHYHRNVDPDTGQISYSASGDYNPILADAIQGLVAKEIWIKAMTNDTTAIRVDALTGKRLPKLANYKNEGPGTSTFLTPSLKDHPGKTFYRDLIHANRDKKTVTVGVSARVSIKQGFLHPAEIGKLKPIVVNIPASSGSRLLDRTQVARLGNLLESNIKTEVPTVEQLCLGGAKLWSEPNSPEWVMEYYQLYNQSRT